MTTMFKFRHVLVVFFLILLVVSACRRKDPEPTGKYINGTFVINEGNFTSSNGEVSFINNADNSITNNIFQAENSRPFAAIIQDAEYHNARLYLVGNRADKVEVVDGFSFKEIGSITTDLTNPISFSAVGNKGYIMNWGAFDANFNTPNPFITVINLSTFAITSRINLSKRPQGSIAVGKNIYIANPTSNTVAVLNTDTDQITSEIVVSNFPQELIIDTNNKIWVICNSGAWVRINPNNNTVEATITGVPTSSFGAKIAINNTLNTLYWLAADPFPASSVRVCQMSINATAAPNTFITTRNNLYGIGYSSTNNLLLGDSKAFQSAGSVLRFDANNSLINEVTAGIAPNKFLKTLR